MTAPTTTAAPTALIGGSGFQRVPGLEITRAERIATPFGDPSDALQFGILAGREWVFLRRHGAGHRIPPHRVNYRANLWALRQAGVARIVACAAVGGIDRALPVGGLVVPEQLIDATWGRAHTFFDGAPGELDALGDLQHIDFSRPYCEALRADLLAAARRAGVAVAPAGVYAVTQGPRLETAAEIDNLARGGATIVGMTGMPEAALARELGLAYATLAIVVNPAAGRAPARIDMAAIAAHLEAGAAKALAVLAQL